jgi:hypothetical protein
LVFVVGGLIEEDEVECDVPITDVDGSIEGEGEGTAGEGDGAAMAGEVFAARTDELID